jgi:CAP12/Pycsar effector protein, TIR domain
MDKSKIFIASSGRTLVLAEKLRDELTTEFCEARLWNEEGRLSIGSTIIEMLESAAEQYDFAVIILAKDDVMTGGEGATLKARDNCVFEAGHFMAAIGRKRCFLVNSVKQSDLPSDLNGIISLPFGEPGDLADRLASARAIASVAAQLKDIVQRDGPLPYHGRVPLLSVDELFRREQPRSDGGDLTDGRVVVCDTQPWGDVDRAVLIRRNIDNGTSYLYFLYFSDDTIEKICQALQVICWARVGDPAGASDFKTRVETITNNKDRVLDDLWDLCRSGKLQVALLPDEPQFRFRVHNASDPTLARFYARYYERGYVLWQEGVSATALWRLLPKYLEDITENQIFIPLKFPILNDENRRRLEGSLSRALTRYFPGMEPQVKRICVGDKF